MAVLSLRASVLGLAFGLAGGAVGCSALIRSDDASFHPGTHSGHGDASPGERLDEGGASVAACDSLGEPLYVKARTPETSAWFGFALAAEGDTLVSVALMERGRNPVNSGKPKVCPLDPAPDDAVGSGAVRVLERQGTSFSEHRLELTDLSLVRPVLPNTTPGGLAFLTVSTYHVALDGNVVAVGVAGDSAVADNRGSVRIFKRSAGAWGPEAYRVEEPGSVAQDLFGMSVALSDTLLAVGATSEDRDEMDAGVVYFYELSDSGYRPVTSVTAPVPQRYAWFGSTVLLSSDWAIVGATGGDGYTSTPAGANVDFAGSVHAFRRSGPAIDARPVPVPAPVLGGAGMGSALALRGDVLAVGAPLAVGCTGESTVDHLSTGQPVPSGAVYLFEVADGEWKLRDCLTTDGDEGGNFFGYAVALTDRFLAVGFAGSTGTSRGFRAPGSPPPTNPAQEEFAGSVRFYPRELDGTITRENYCVVKAPNPDACDVFGNSVVATETLLAVGAPTEDGRMGGTTTADEDNALLDSGAIYVYPLAGAPAW